MTGTISNSSLRNSEHYYLLEKTWSDHGKLLYNYVKAHPKKEVEVQALALKGAATGAGVGLMAGLFAAVGSRIGYAAAYSTPWTAVPTTIWATFQAAPYVSSAYTLGGTAIGAGGGAAIGLASGRTSIIKSTEYIDWKMRAIQARVFPILARELQHDPMLKEMVCPISMDFITDPVGDPTTISRIDGEPRTFYERRAIEHWIDQAITNGREALSPVTRQPITAGALMPAPHYICTVAKRMKELLPTTLGSLNREGMQAYIKAAESERQKVGVQASGELLALRTSGAITEQEYNERIAEVTRKYLK